MSTAMASWRELLLAALGEQATINVREALAVSMGRVPSAGEIAAARRAARRIAEDGKAVLMTLHPGQAEGADRWRWGRQAVLHLTVDTQVVTELPYRAEVAASNWEDVINEGKRRTQQMIDNDPLLSSFLSAGAHTPRRG
ncbi:hypothetical protein [Streptomyces sp. MK37H]|uniref:hypothetical protein n=1 Tax=Streptomyces sp. MK37H TaxID=2699117 RepID=UPI001B390D2C|nr:hypothetical protein [Streptomyces sp. MK37H]MBP8537209.1 hypothetical protein [Streptomyces sp. MK37H]